MRTPAAAAALVAGVVAGCGGATSSSGACAPASPIVAGPGSIAAGPLLASLDPPRVPAGQTLHLRVSARGPAAYAAPCDGPLTVLIAADPADIHVFTAAPPAAQGTPCGSVTLAAGQTADYDVDWTPDQTLPAGVYRAVLTLGDQPPLVLRFAMATSPVIASCSP